MTNHTELPWEALLSKDKDDDECYDLAGVESEGFTYIGEVTGYRNKPNAAFIVKACNNHYQLMEALEKLACLGNGDFYGNSDGNRIAQAAIKQAEMEEEL